MFDVLWNGVLAHNSAFKSGGLPPPLKDRLMQIGCKTGYFKV